MLSVPTPLKWTLRIVAITYVFLLVAWPVSTIVREAFADGPGTLIDLFQDPQVAKALSLTVQVAVQAVLINLVFGVGVSILLVRYVFPGKRMLVGADRPADGGVSRRGRPLAAPGLQRPGRLVRPDARGVGHQDHLQRHPA